MFLDIVKFRIKDKQKIFKENCFENVALQIHKKDKFCPYKPPKIMNVSWFLAFSRY